MGDSAPTGKHTSSEKPGFFRRLGSLILFQAIFVLLALVLILTVPGKPEILDGDLATPLLVLFLGSATVSVLILLLLRRGFQKPLQRLTRGLEKTADGELFVLSENYSDKELHELATAFNAMSHTLWKNRQALTNFNRQLSDLNTSLIRSQEFLRTLVSSTPLCTVVASPEGKIILFNDRAAEEFGYTPGEASQLGIETLFSASSRGEILNLRETGEGSSFETRCRRKGGQSFPAYVISQPAATVEGELLGYIYIIRDITESRGYQDMIVRLDRYYTKGEMAGDIAHEINNYLAILSGNIELLPMLLRRGDSERMEKKLSIMKDTTDKIARFTDGLLDAPQEEPRFEPIDMNQLVANVLAFMEPQNKFDAIEVSTDLSDELPLVEVDPYQIQQLLVNYLYNAADAVGLSDVPRRIRVITSFGAGASEHFCRLGVVDSGPGVPDEKVSMLFRKRFTTKKRGHGIGLITCRKIAELHGGSVGYNHENAQTTFHCELPISQAARRPETRTEEVSSARPVAP